MSLVGVLLSFLPLQLPEALAADRIVLGATVLTMDDELSRAEAFAVKDGRFLIVGSTAEVLGTRGERTVVTELEGRAVVPGFIDAHCHPRSLYDEDSIHAVAELGPSEVGSIDE